MERINLWVGVLQQTLGSHHRKSIIQWMKSETHHDWLLVLNHLFLTFGWKIDDRYSRSHIWESEVSGDMCIRPQPWDVEIIKIKNKHPRDRVRTSFLTTPQTVPSSFSMLPTHICGFYRRGKPMEVIVGCVCFFLGPIQHATTSCLLP